MINNSVNEAGPSRAPRKWLRLLCHILALYAIVGGAVSFLGWPADLPYLTSWFGGPSAQPNTAVAVTLAGAALIALLNGYRGIGGLFAALVAAIGSLTLVQIVTGMDLGIDRLLLFGRDWGQFGVTSPGRMGRPAALALTLLGSGLLLLACARSRDGKVTRPGAANAGLALGFTSLVIALLSLAGYLHGAAELYLVPTLTAIALQTATFIFAIALALVLSVPEIGFARLLADETAAGEMFRRLVPAVLLISFAFGAATLAGERLGLYDARFETAIRTIIEVCLLTGLLWWTGHTIGKHIHHIRQKELDLESLADAMPQLVWIAGADGKVVYYNKRSSQYQGIVQNEGGLYEWAPSVHPGDLEKTADSWETAVKTRKIYECEHRVKMSDGSYRWHLSRGIPTTDPVSGETKWYGTATDIHDLKEAQEAVWETEVRLQHALDAGKIGVWEYSTTDRKVYLDPRMREMAGLAPDEEITPEEAVHRFIPKTDLPMVREKVARALDPSSSGSIKLELRLRPEAGGSRWLQILGQVAAGSDGRSVLRGTAVDITDRKRIEESQNFLFSISETIRLAATPGELFADVGAAVGKHFGAASCEFFSVDVDNSIRTRLGGFSRTAESPEEAQSFSGYSPITLGQVAEGRTVVVNDSQSDVRTAQYYDAGYGPRGEVAYVVVPLLRDGKWSAIFWCSDTRRRQWTDFEIGVLEAIGERAWAAAEKMRAETNLRESEQRFRTMADGLSLLVWVHGPVGEQQFVNQTFCSFFGVTFEEMRGHAWQALMHPDDAEEYTKEFLLATAERREFHGETRVKDQKGEWRWLESWARPRFGVNGEFLGMVGASADVTARKAAENRLRESEQRFRVMADGLPLMVWLYGPQGEQQYQNRAVAHFFGERSEELSNDGWKNFVYPEDHDGYAGEFSRALADQRQFHAEARVFDARGDLRWIESWAQPRFGKNGEFLGMVGASADVTDRKEAEQLLRESEERFRNVSDSAPVLIWVADANNNGTWFNRPWLEFTGRSLEEEVGTGWLDLIHPDDVARTTEICTRAFDARETFSMEFRMRRADGEYRWLMDTGVPRFAPNGEFLGYIGSCVDIHDRHTALNALRASEARLTLATEIGNYGTWDIDYTTGKMIWSDKLFEIFGIKPTPGHVIDIDLFYSFIHPGDADHLRKVTDEAIEDLKDYAVEYRISRGDNGETRWISARAEFFANAEGEIVRSVGVAQDITEARAAAEALRTSEERLKLAQDAGNVGVWDYDLVSETTYWSDGMWRLYGQDPGDSIVPNDLWNRTVHPDDIDGAIERARGTLSSDGAEYRNEFRIVLPDGEVRWLEAIAQIERGPDGKPTRMYGVSLDLTEKKAVAEKIRASEAQLRLITDSIPALVSYVDSNERYKFVNRRYTEWFGKGPEELVGHSMIDVLGDMAYDVFKPHIDAALRGESSSFDTWANYKGAGPRYVHVSYVPDFDLSGEVLGFYVLVTDLSDLRRSQDLLRSSEERMQLLSESFTDYAIISMDVNGLIESWNPGAMNIFGYHEDEIIGRSGAVLFTPEDVEAGVPEAEMASARANGRAVDERWHVKKDGTRFFASGVMAPLYVGDGLTGYAKIASDLTERKRSAEALQRAHDEMETRVIERTRELAEMNRTLLSEINERKTAERQKIELLQRLVSTQEDERRRIARDLHDQLGQRLTALRLKLASLREACSDHPDLADRTVRLQQIAETLDSEVSFLTWELRPSALDELGVVEAIETFVKEWSRHYDIPADFHTAGLVNIEWHRDAEIQLYRIAQEALNNIVKHSKATRVGVLLERSDESAILIIEDNGSGFSLNGNKRSDNGRRGFGLAGMRERAELIGGKFEIESESGAGTTIHVRVPIGAGRKE